MRFGYLHYIIKGQESQWAAEASECAGEQGEESFWAYHDKLFAVTASKPYPPFNKADLKQFAEEVGLEPQAFNACLDSGKFTSVVEIDTQIAQIMGFQSTPSFLINGNVLIGAQPFKVFGAYIDALLGKSQKDP